MYLISEIEDAIIASLVSCGLSARPLSAPPEENELEREAAGGPVVLVAYDGGEPVKPSSNSARGAVFHFRLLMAARDLRGTAHAARGDTASAGLYRLLDVARSALSGGSAGLQIQPMRWVSEGVRSRSPRLSVYEQVWSVTAYEQGAW